MISIQAEERPDNKIGSYFAQQYRKQGKIPANFYGTKVKNINFIVDMKEIKKITNQAKRTVISLEFGDKIKNVIMQDIQYHPVSMVPLHVDFLEVPSDKKVKVQIPIRYLNTDKCIGVKQGGFLNRIYRHLPCTCLPENIPEHIEIDTTDFHVKKVLKLPEINLPEKVMCLIKDKDASICSVIGRAKKATEDENSEDKKE